MTNKPKIPSKFLPVMLAANNFINNSSLFSNRGFTGTGYGYTGGDNLADTKHAKLWQDFGYPDFVEFYMHWHMYRRNGLAGRVIKLPTTICWLTNPWVEENREDDSEDKTEYEKAFERLCDDLMIWSNMQDGDLQQRVGRYSGLIFTVRDGKPKSKPLGKIRTDQIVRIQPVFEGQLIPGDIELDRKNERYGLPTTYSFQSGNVGNRNERNTDGGTIHWTRVLILSEDAFGSEIYGVPALEGIFNALLNWQKTQGASAEGLWRQAAQRFVLQAAGDTESQEYSPEELSALGEMVADMFAGFDAIPAVGNYELKGLNTGTIPNPAPTAETCLQEVSAGSGIPAKMISGTQTGVKAADEDTKFYFKEMQSRRNKDITKWVRSLIDWLDKHTELAKPESGVKVCWDDLTAPTVMERLEAADKMADINQKQKSAGEKAVFHAQEMREAAGHEYIDALGDWEDESLLEEIVVEDAAVEDE